MRKRKKTVNKGEKVIYFELLGSFSYGEGRRQTRSVPKAGKKTLSFLQYLIVNHERSISVDELIEMFWTEDRSSAPANALRNMLFKVRNLLKKMFPEQTDLLLTFPGCYTWNPAVRLEADTEQFEFICLEARKKSGEECYRLLMQAIVLYKGEFLGANDSEWALVLRQYYRTLYVDACRLVLPLLCEKKQWLDVISICDQGYKSDFTLEDFTACQMQALVELGQPEQAVEKYEAFRGRMQQEFGIAPTERIEQIYILAVGLCKRDIGVQEIFKLMQEDKSDGRAFFCTFEMFQSIAALEKRHLARSGKNSSLAIIRLGAGAVLSSDSRRLERVLLEGLRAGDPVARLEAGSYMLLLTGTGIDDALLVMSRIDSTFHKTYRHSRARLLYHVVALNPEGLQKT